MDKDNLYYLISQNIKKQRKIKGWNKAVKYSFGWAKEEEEATSEV